MNKKVYKNLIALCDKHAQCLTKNERKVILNEDWEDGKFYILPKIEKCQEIKDQIEEQNSEYIHMNMPDTLTGRPIVGCSNRLHKEQASC